MLGKDCNSKDKPQEMIPREDRSPSAAFCPWTKLGVLFPLMMIGIALVFMITAEKMSLAANKSLKTRVGSQFTYDIANGRLPHQRYFLRQEASSLMHKRSLGLSFYSNLYFAIDTETEFADSRESYTIRPDSLYAEFQKGALRLTAGMQQLTWGETFGIPVVDVVNPIDVTEPFSSDLANSKIAVPLVTAEVIGQSVYVQGIINPLARRSPLPDSVDGVPVRELPDPQLGNDIEYGGRIGYLTSFGLDIKAIYYRHFNRLPRLVGGLDTTTGTPVLRAAESMQQSIGVAASQAFDSIVIRFDGLYEKEGLEQLNDPGAPTTLPQVKVTDRVQGALGFDWSSLDGDLIGAQIQAMEQLPRPGDSPAVWGGARVSLNLWSERLILDVFALHGIGNDEWWVRPQVSARLSPRLTWLTEINLMDSNGQTSSDIFAYRRTLNSSLSYRF